MSKEQSPKKGGPIIIIHNKKKEKDVFDGRSFLERSRMELEEKGPITLYRERYTLTQLRCFAEDGIPDAQYYLAEYYYYGTGDATDMDIAIKWYNKAANQGHVEAQYSLGHIYEFGECEKIDYEEAKKWYGKAAEKGHCKAQVHLSFIYSIKGQENLKLAFKWMLKAAEHDDFIFQTDLAYMYENGIGVEQDYEKAFEWYLKAGYKGDNFYYHKIGDCYRFGKGVEVDYERAAYWYLKSVREKAYQDEALDALGFIYLTGGNNLKPDFKKAINWFKKAAKREEDIAVCFMDYINENGEEAGHDLERFKEWLYEKAGKGDRKAGGALSSSYEYGYITPIDEAKSKGWEEFAYGDLLEKVREKEKNRVFDYKIRKDMPAYMKALYLRKAREREELRININE